MSIATPRSIDDDVLDVLRNIECEGIYARITRQVDRGLYVRTNKVLEALGGKWSRKARAHVFEDDAWVAIADAVSSGTYTKNPFAFFETPEHVADELVVLASVPADNSRPLFLEPSAGRGAICQAIMRRFPQAVIFAVEIDEAMANRLSQILPEPSYPRLRNCDFLKLEDDELPLFDAVVMNPPFNRGQDMQHVLHAWQFVRPGGCLVSVMSPSWTFRQDRKAVEFQQFAARQEAGWEMLPAGTFKAAGTMVNTGIFWARKGK